MCSTNAETAVSYAALILADANVAITPEKLQTILHASGIEDVEPIWTSLFAKALEGKNLKEILTTVATSASDKRGEGTGPETATDGKSDGDKTDDEAGGESSGAEDESDEDLGNLFDL